MVKQAKKLLSAVLTIALTAGSIAVPIGASAADYTPLVEGDTVLKEWKFDFGSADNVMDGYIAVTPDKNVIMSKGTDAPYGFIGNDGNGSKVTPKYDSFEYKEGQIMKLVEGGSGENDGIGIEKNDEETYPQYTTGEYYPVSFGLYVNNGSYYRVRATITTLDPTKDAEASLYYERRHPVVHKQKINAGETLTVDFSADVEKINFKNDGGNFNDDMLNISLLGENSALSSLVIQQIDEEQENKPTTLWVLGDSTVTDGSASVPYFDLQNYTGVGAYLSKYVPSTVAVSNQGEGGLNATDNNHFAIARDNIKPGDFMYVEYGHNHKGDPYTGEYWLHNYVSSLPKYYNACKQVGATLIIVGPMDRHNTSQFDSATNTWTTTLKQFSDIGKQYVDVLMYGGESAATSFIAKWKEIADYAETHKTGNKVNEGADAEKVVEMKAEADKIVTDAVAGNTVAVQNLAFVDLNKPTLDWLSTVTAIEGSEGGNHALSNYYFTTARGDKTDGTHPNDAGADALAHKFFSTADVEAYPALTPLLTAYEDKEPVPVSADIIAAGSAGSSDNPYWPIYASKVSYDYATVIKRVTFNENNSPTGVEIKVQDKSMMSTYSNAYFALYNKETGVLEGFATSTDHVDNTVGGTATLPFETDLTYDSETQTYKVFLWGYEDKPEEGNPSTMQPYAAVYVPTDVEKYLITGENGAETETFAYYGATKLDEVSTYTFGGSAGHDFTLGEDENGVTYARIMSDGLNSAGALAGSFYLSRKFDEEYDTSSDKKIEYSTGSNKKIMIDTDIKYASGDGLNFGFAKAVLKNSPFIDSGNGFTAFTVGTDGEISVGGTKAGNLIMGQWTNVHYVLDMNTGKASVSVNGQAAVEADVSNYLSFDAPVPDTFKYFLMEGQRKAFDMSISNMTVAVLSSKDIEDKTITVKVSDDCKDMGDVYIGTEGTLSATVKQGQSVTLTAKAKQGYVFSSWKDEDGKDVSFVPEFQARAYRAADLTAVFEKEVADKYDYLYHETFKTLTTASLSENGWKSTNAQSALTVENDTNDAIGNYLRFGANSNSRFAAKTFDSKYTSDKGLAFCMTARFNKSNKDPNQITIHGGNQKYVSNNQNYGAESGYILLIEQDKAGAATVNGETTTIPDNTWFNVTASCDFANHTVEVNITSLDGQTSYYSGTVAMNDAEATGISGIYMRFGGTAYGAISADNLEIFTADQLTK